MKFSQGRRNEHSTTNKKNFWNLAISEKPIMYDVANRALELQYAAEALLDSSPVEQSAQQVPHITDAQFKVLHINNHVDGSLRALNCLIDEVNTEQEQSLISAVPRITQKHWNDANMVVPTYSSFSDVCNKAIEIALAEQATEKYITAEEARALGAGKAEWSITGMIDWYVCGQMHIYSQHSPLNGKPLKYRAIKPEPVQAGWPSPNAKRKQVSWKDVPVGVTVQEIQSKFRHTLLSIDSGDGAWIFSQRDKTPTYIVVEELKLAPASEQPWIPVQDTGIAAVAGLLIQCHRSGEKYRVTGLAEGWVLR